MPDQRKNKNNRRYVAPEEESDSISDILDEVESLDDGPPPASQRDLEADHQRQRRHQQMEEEAREKEAALL